MLGTRGAYVVDELDGQEDALRGPVGPRWGGLPSRRSGGPPGPGRGRTAGPSAPGRWDRFYTAGRGCGRGAGPVPVDPMDAVRALEVMRRRAARPPSGRSSSSAGRSPACAEGSSCRGHSRPDHAPRHDDGTSPRAPTPDPRPPDGAPAGDTTAAVSFDPPTVSRDRRCLRQPSPRLFLRPLRRPPRRVGPISRSRWLGPAARWRRRCSRGLLGGALLVAIAGDDYGRGDLAGIGQRTRARRPRR